MSTHKEIFTQMKKQVILSTVFLLAMNSCSKEEIINDDSNINFEKRISVVAEDLTTANGTRTTYNEGDNGYHFAWTEGDALGIFPENGYQTAFPINEGKGVGTNTAVFDGGDWALKANKSYAAYYPLVDKLSIDYSAIPMDYTGQVQNGNGSTAHLSAYDYMASTFTEVDANGNVNFQLQHLGCLVQFKLTMPEADSYTALKITSNNTPFITCGEYSLSDNGHVLQNVQKSETVAIGLKNVTTTAEEKDITITAMFAPVNLSNSILTLTIKGNQNDYEIEIVGQDFAQGSCVKITSAVSDLYAYQYSYVPAHWMGEPTIQNSNKVLPVYPFLDSDPLMGYRNYGTTQFVKDLTQGYINTSGGMGIKPDDYTVLLKNGVQSDIVFDKERLSMLPALDHLAIKDGNGTILQKKSWAISEDGKQLFIASTDPNTGQIISIESYAARIGDFNNQSNKYIYLIDSEPNSTTGSLSSQGSDAALLLVGHDVPVKVVANSETVDRYLVRFISPLECTTTFPEIDGFEAHFSQETISLPSLDVILREAFGMKSVVTGALNQWYGVSDPYIQKNGVLIGISMYGTPLPNTEDPIQAGYIPFSNIMGWMYDLQFSEDNSKVTLYNTSGNALVQDLYIKIPVVINTKWQRIVKYITLKVPRAF